MIKPGKYMRHKSIVLTTALVCLLAAGDVTLALQQKAPTPATAARPAESFMPLEAQRAFLAQYCTTCHNDTAKTGGMTLTSLDLTHPDQTAELAEKLIKKLR